MILGETVGRALIYECFDIPAVATDPTPGLVVVVQSGTRLKRLLVDGLLHKQEVVIKNLNGMLVHKNRAFAGATILRDGRVRLILDVNALAHPDSQSFSKAA